MTTRPARPDDVPVLVELVRELASYERAPDQVELHEALLDQALFGPSPKVFAHVAEDEGVVQGMAVWFVTYSTWTGRHGIHLEDLFVRPTARGQGAGRGLLSALARTAIDAGYRRLEWNVLDWNEPAIGFYRQLGAVPMTEWSGYRLSGPALEDLADGN